VRSLIGRPVSCLVARPHDLGIGGEKDGSLVDPEVRPDRQPLPQHQIDAGGHVITAEQPLPHDLRTALDKIHNHRRPH
jgi:hypothetical protein